MKHNILKRTFAAGLAVLCIAAYASAVGNTGLFNTAVTASAETLTNGNYEYTLLNNGTVEITKYVGSAAKLTIPSNIGGKAVTIIGDGAFKYCRTLTSITVPNGVTGISDWAFYECSHLIIDEKDLTRYDIDCANVNNDITVDTLDLIRLKRHLINIEPLW